VSAFADEIIPLGMTGDYINGLGFKEADWSSEGLPIIRIQNLTNSAKPFNRTLREVDDRFKVQNGDILVSWSATLDAFIWRRGAAILNQHIFKVVPDTERVEPGFLFYQLKSIIWQMSHGEHAHGSTMKHINRKPFLSHPFWCPALSQQREIASKLDRSFSGLENSEKQLQHLQSKLKQARASILKAAVDGKLCMHDNAISGSTETKDHINKWEQEINALKYKNRTSNRSPGKKQHTCLQSCADEKGWIQATVSEIANVQLGRQRSPKDHNGPWMTPYLRAANITWDGLALVDVNSMNFDPSERERFALKVGDILLNEASGSASEVGKPAIWRGEIPDCCFQNTLLRVRTIPSLQRWILLHFVADAKSGHFSRSSKGVGIHHLSANTLSAHIIRIPPPEQQERIVAEVDRRFSVLDQVEATVTTSLARCVKLRQAILKRAFGG
jgi:type I restriction enzyme S subunit